MRPHILPIDSMIVSRFQAPTNGPNCTLCWESEDCKNINRGRTKPIGSKNFKKIEGLPKLFQAFDDQFIDFFRSFPVSSFCSLATGIILSVSTCIISSFEQCFDFVVVA